MSKVTQMMRPLTKQPALGTTVRIFLRNGVETTGHCTLIHGFNGSAYHWYIAKGRRTHNHTPPSKIKGWMPITPMEVIE